MEFPPVLDPDSGQPLPKPGQREYERNIPEKDIREFFELAKHQKELFHNIQIVVPVRGGGGIEPQLASMLAIWQMVGVTWQPLLDYGGGFIECTRANIARTFLEQMVEKYLIMIDDDMVPNLWLPYLLARHDKPVVGCCAMALNQRHGPMLCFTVKDENGDYRFPSMWNKKAIPARGLVEVGHAGTGALCIRRDVLESFGWVPGDTPFYVNEKVRQLGHTTGELRRGEDIEFSSQVRKKGYGVYVDLEAHVGHRKSLVLSWDEDLIDENLDAKDWKLPVNGMKIRGD